MPAPGYIISYGFKVGIYMYTLYIGNVEIYNVSPPPSYSTQHVHVSPEKQNAVTVYLSSYLV